MNLDSVTAGDSVLQRVRDNRPIYDRVDAALLAPRGVSAHGAEQKLSYSIDDDSRYVPGVTIVNEDRTLVGRLIEAVNRVPVAVRLDVEVQTADGTIRRTYEIRQNFSPGSWVSIPLADFGIIGGPAWMRVTAQNIGSLYTAVIIGATRVLIPSRR
jgi:hypothetical protein